MKILERENNMMILEHGDFTYLISYNTIIAKVCNTIKKNNNEYGLYFTCDWDYSNTTLKHLYYFIELYSTQRDNKNNTFACALDEQKTKHKYLEEQIELKNIKLIRSGEM